MKKQLIVTGLATAAGVVGAMEGYNLVARRRSAALESPVVGRQETYLWKWGRIAYYVEGDGPATVLVHGIHAAASTYEMRELFGPLTGAGTVYALDLLGFGHSDRPGLQYTAALYLDLLTDFLRDVVQRPCHVVASSLSGAYAVEVARRLPEQVVRLTLLCPAGVETLAQPPTATGHALNLLFRAPVTGEFLFNLLASGPSLRYYLARQAYADPSLVTDEVVASYYATSHRPNARYAPAAFLGGYLNWDAREAWRSLAQPVLLIWGSEARLTPVAEGQAFVALNPRARLEVLDRAKLLPHVERPDRVVQLVLEHALSRTEREQTAY
jgi:pimeloyl-ACP methyl ester carboxylesterase